MKRYLTLIIVLYGCLSLHGQNQAQYNHYIGNQGILNPAYNGTRDVISGMILHRSQWIGFKGAPLNQAFNIHGPIEDTNIGLGAVLTNDHVGFTNTFDFFGAASYRFQINRKQFVSLGLQLGVGSVVYDGTKAEMTDPGDPVFDGKQSLVNFNVGFGGYWYAEEYFAGLSIPKFFSNSFDEGADDFKNRLDPKNMHSYLYGGYVFEWGEVMVKPTLLSKIVYGAPLEFDVSANVLLMQKLWLGVSYRSVSDVVFLAEYIVDRRFTVRYAFEYPISTLNNYGKFGSHELSLQFDFTYNKRAGMRSIRYF
jgi:type IX secretion system PorP/SprF family membrane protein